MDYNPILQILMYPDFKDGHIIHWTIDPVYALVRPFKYVIQVTGTPDFSEILYELDAGEITFLRDTTRTKQSWADDLYYRVKLIETNKVYVSSSLKFGVDKTSQKKYAMAHNIIRKEMLVMTRKNGNRGWLLKRKSYGAAVATEEVDEISGVQLTDNTGNYGINIVGGYYTPIGIYYTVQQSVRKRQQSPDGFGTQEILQCKLRTIGFPPIDTKDILVDADDNSRYNVDDIQQTLFPGTKIAVVQNINAMLIPNTDSVYQIPVPHIDEFH